MSPYCGATDTRARVGLRPTSPQQAAGMRMDPPPSLACATGTMPDATAAADPPDEPPVEWLVFHGLRDGPNRRGSVVGRMPNSGVLVLPQMAKPARSKRFVSSWSTVEW